MMSAESVAKSILTGIERGKYLILPGIENKLVYRLSGIFSNAVYPVMDWFIAQAQRKNNSAGK